MKGKPLKSFQELYDAFQIDQYADQIQNIDLPERKVFKPPKKHKKVHGSKFTPKKPKRKIRIQWLTLSKKKASILKHKLKTAKGKKHYRKK